MPRWPEILIWDRFRSATYAQDPYTRGSPWFAIFLPLIKSLTSAVVGHIFQKAWSSHNRKAKNHDREVICRLPLLRSLVLGKANLLISH